MIPLLTPVIFHETVPWKEENLFTIFIKGKRSCDTGPLIANPSHTPPSLQRCKHMDGKSPLTINTSHRSVEGWRKSRKDLVTQSFKVHIPSALLIDCAIPNLENSKCHHTNRRHVGWGGLGGVTIFLRLIIRFQEIF